MLVSKPFSRAGCLILLTILLVSSCRLEPQAPIITELRFESAPSANVYEFHWSSPDEAYLQRLRMEYDLDRIVAGAGTDLARVQAITDWVSNLWKHDGNNIPERGDPISILEGVRQGERYRCVEYAVVINGSLNALGIPARQLNLRTSDMETRESGAGHVVVEAYLPDAGQWVFVDGQWGAIPMLGGEPLDSIEFQRALINKAPDLTFAGLPENQKENYLSWIAEYLYYFETPLDARISDQPRQHHSIMLVPLGAKKPKVFQRKYRLENMEYTNSTADFYPQPPLSTGFTG